MPWLQINNDGGSAWLESDPGMVVGTGFTFEMDVYVPTSTAQAILDHNGGATSYTADWFELKNDAGYSMGGVFAEVTTGPTLTQWNDQSPNPANGSIPLDTPFHITWTTTYESGTNWTFAVAINGTQVDTASGVNLGVDNTGVLNAVQVGGLFPDNTPGEVYFVSNILLKDESNATVISSNFTGTTLPGPSSPWTGSGNVSRLSLVSSPSTPLAPIVLEVEDDMDADTTKVTTVSAAGNVYLVAGSSPEIIGDGEAFTGDYEHILTQGESHAWFWVRGNRLPPPGTYNIELLIRGATNGGTGNNQATINVRRNGVEITPSTDVKVPFGADSWQPLNQPFPTDNSDGGGKGPSVFPIAAGDVYEFAVENWSGITVAVDKIRFTNITQGGGPGPPVPMLTVPQPAGGGTFLANDARIDSTKDCDVIDMCVTSNGDVYGIWTETDETPPHPCLIVVRKYSGGSWTTITTDIAGHGSVSALNPWVACATDGTDVYFMFGDFDGTSVAGDSNQCWRVQKYSGGALTELGSPTGQRQIVSRSVHWAALGDQGTPFRLFCSPGGTPWACWVENPDAVDIVGPAAIPHAWYWSGSAWVDSGLTPATHVHPFYDASVVSNCREFGMCFPGNGENPALIFGYQDGTGGDPARLAFQYQEWSGGAWGNTIDFLADDVWPDLISNGGGHYHQGINLFEWSGKIWMTAALNFGIGSGLQAQGVLGCLNDAHTAFVPPVSGKYWDRPTWDSSEFTGGYRSGWGQQTSNSPAVDSEGYLWLAGSWQWGVNSDFGGPAIWGYREVGTTDGWSIAHYDPYDHNSGGTKLPPIGEIQLCEAPFAFHGTTYYMLYQLYDGPVATNPLVLLTGDRDVPYVPYLAGGVGLMAYQRF